MTASRWNPRLLGFACEACGSLVKPDDIAASPTCAACDRPRVARYAGDLGPAERESLAGTGLARWHRLLPFSDALAPVGPRAGGTPLVPLPGLARRIGVREVWLKDETPNPTQSFKARGMEMAVHAARTLGIRKLALPSAGNAGSAAAAYATAAGIACRVTVPEQTPEPFVLEQRGLGAEVRLVPGTLSDAGAELKRWAPAPEWWNVATFREPFRLEGKKTLGFEIAEQLGWRLPRAIFYPTGGGTGLVGMAQAFDELRAIGWIAEPSPRFIAVQAEGCAPIVRAFDRGAPRSEPWPDAVTVASGLRVPAPYADTLILKALRNTGGTAIAVGEMEMLDAMVTLSRESGIQACPEGGATLAGLEQERAAGRLDAGDSIVIMNTGSGIKYPDAWRTALQRATAVATLAVSLVLGGFGARAVAAGPEPAEHPTVVVTRLDGPVTPVMVEALDHALGRAERDRRAALVVELDTPGGLETSMRSMVKRMLASQVPVIVWVSPGGARAASAGVFITMAADVAAMAPGTNIGAASPVQLTGSMDSTMARKAMNDASAFARTVARQRGRNVEWAEGAVRQAVAVADSEAVAQNIVDFVARDVPELLDRADGRTWKRGDAARTLHTRGATIERIEPGLRLKLLAMLVDPNVAYILMLIGFYGILFELQNPGAILPGVVGGIALILAFYALATLPVNAAGVALIVLAIAFFVAEVKVNSHGLLAAGGVLALVLGSIFLFHGDQVRVSWNVIAAGTLVTTAFFLVVVAAGIRAQRRPLQSGPGSMVGERGLVIDRIAGTGRVRLGDTLWNARSASPIDAGVEVEITGVHGLTLEVRPLAKEA